MKERADIQVTWIDIVEINERQKFKAFPVTRKQNCAKFAYNAK